MTDLDLWGSKLSPFSNKAEACIAFTGRSYRNLPAEGGRVRNLLTAMRIQNAKKKRTITRYGGMTPLDEYPLVPFLLQADGGIQYDTSGMSRWLDEHAGGEARLWPEDPVLSFVAQLIDEAFDEFVLYVLHHQRWVVSINTTWATRALYEEFKKVPFLPKREKFMHGFAQRQLRRLPYTMSVAPPDCDTDAPSDFKPPVIEGWPGTHTLLELSWTHYLHGLEAVLSERPWLLGEHFTIADASVFGGLEALQFDPDSAADVERRAPATSRWRKRIRAGGHAGGAGELSWTDSLLPLLETIMETFVVLMQQNEAAYAAWRDRGETVFNEKAHEQGRALYDGQLLGFPFRMVVKTFQVQVWRDLLKSWSALADDQRAELAGRLPGLSLNGQPPATAVRLVGNETAKT